VFGFVRYLFLPLVMYCPLVRSLFLSLILYLWINFFSYLVWFSLTLFMSLVLYLWMSFFSCRWVICLVNCFRSFVRSFVLSLWGL